MTFNYRLAALLILAIGSLGPASARAQVHVSDDDSNEASATDLSSATDLLLPAGDDSTRWSVRADWLYWLVQGNPLPPLVTTSPDGTPRPAAGVLPGAQILAGNERVDDAGRSGARVTLGYWFDDVHSMGVEASWFYLGTGGNTGDFAAQSNTSPILARPFFNVALGAPDSQLVTFPGVVDGQTVIATSSEMQSVGLLLHHSLRTGIYGHLDLVGGYRYLQYREALSIRESLVLTGGGLIQKGTTIDLTDSFRTDNEFQGGELGLALWVTRGRWTWDASTKLGLGNVHQMLAIRGDTTATTPGDAPVHTPGGLLALPSNMGPHAQDRFALLPELNLNLRHQLTDRLGLSVGYSLLFLTSVLRTGDQIDTQIDATQLPTAIGGPAAAAGHPNAPQHASTLWAQGLSAGLAFSY
jgi:hypothetical protein